ncbi:MAG: helix-turn-helix transcriptional regulator [Victivallaceae bacterium]|nr:helix-turn-helix transcriptional regulator [Victivallaceae bacterium]
MSFCKNLTKARNGTIITTNIGVSLYNFKTKRKIMSDNEQYVNILLSLMAKNKWDQEMLARRLMVCPSTLSRWISRKTKITKKNQAWIDQISSAEEKTSHHNNNDFLANAALEKFNKLSEHNKALAIKYIIELIEAQEQAGK